MIDQRILEILKTPDSIEATDLNVLQNNIRKYPYLQSLRALFLYGTHRFQPGNYEKELSTTAAYTTDKKILYQFINRKNLSLNEIQKEDENVIHENLNSEEEADLQILNTENNNHSQSDENVDKIHLSNEDDGLKENISHFDDHSGNLVPDENSNIIENEISEVNPENTTDFKNTDVVDDLEKQQQENSFAETQDAENFTKEEIVSETLPTQSISEIKNNDNNSFQEVEPLVVESPTATNSEEIQKEKDSVTYSESEDAETFTREENIRESSIKKEEKQIEDPSALSFHGTDDFLPNIKMEVQKTEKAYEVPKPKLNRHEEEMQRLIAEVEAKMKANKKSKPQKTTTEPEVNNFDINFSESQLNEETIVPKEEIKVSEKINDSDSEHHHQTNIKDEKVKEEPSNSSWKPMNFQQNAPDSTLKVQNKNNEAAEVESNSDAETQREAKSDNIDKKRIEDVSSLKDENKTIEKSTTSNDDLKSSEENSSDSSTDENTSNIPQFINTWQSWLQLDHSSKIPLANTAVEVVEESPATDPISESVGDVSTENTEEVKQKAIEKFIETEPKISKLKEESEFIIKEKSDDISHLMTETLAKIYVEQRLYSKGIKAYETLKEKHPEKTTYFDECIQEIKELRTNFK